MGLLSKSIGTKIPLILPFSFMFLKKFLNKKPVRLALYV